MSEAPGMGGTGELVLDRRCLGPHAPSGVALAGGDGVRLTYAELRAAAEAVRACLEEAGVGNGHRAAVLLPAGPAFVAALLAVVRSGAAAAPLDPWTRGASLSGAIGALRPHVLVTSAALLRRLPELADVPVPVARVEGPDASTGRVDCRVARPAPTARRDRKAEEVRPEDDALLLTTSGTTGVPKYVRLSHRAVCANIDMHLESLGLDRPFVALQLLPVNYSYGLVASCLSALAAGGTVVLPRHNDRRHVAAALVEHEPQVCLGTPSVFRFLLDGAEAVELDAFGRLRKIGVGGERCPPPQRRRLREWLPAAEIFVTYGMTEAGPRIATLPPALLLEREHSVGRPLRGVQVRIVDGDSETVAPGAVGVLHVRTPSLMSGYLGDPGTAAAPDGGRWWSTGDLASLDEDGLLQIHGRNDRQLKLRGRRINPAAIERVLEAHPAVLRATVECLGDGGAERIRATVRHHRDAAPALRAELEAHCKRNLPRSLVPDDFVMAVDAGLYLKGSRAIPAGPISGDRVAPHVTDRLQDRSA